jgi:hypothetical protein|tara:strand:- start:796 stop:1194 length:399 start_codon:yes stop_codon:yes gene_type:complete
MSNAKISIEKLTATYIKIRDKRSKLATEFKTKDDELKSQQDRIKRALLEHCKEHDVESVRTAEGLFYRTIKKRFWTNDWESMHKFILDQQVPEFLDKRLNQSNVKQFLEDNPDLLPPGLNVDSEYAIAVRKK